MTETETVGAAAVDEAGDDVTDSDALLPISDEEAGAAGVGVVASGGGGVGDENADTAAAVVDAVAAVDPSNVGNNWPPPREGGIPRTGAESASLQSSMTESLRD